MQYHKQLNIHDPENGVYGDCGRTVIACLLNMKPEEVPHFYDGVAEGNQEATNTALASMVSWLEAQGFAYSTIPFIGYYLSVSEMLAYAGSVFPIGYYILLGMSANSHNHVVVCKGDKIIHDPAIDNSGIIGPANDGHYWIELIYKTLEE